MHIIARGRRTALSLGEDSGWLVMGAAEARDARVAMVRVVRRMAAVIDDERRVEV